MRPRTMMVSGIEDRAGSVGGSLSSAPARFAIACIAVYRRFVSALLPPLCRFYPSCSAYAQQAIAKHGLLRGLGMALVRLSKCHPLHPGGFDPVAGSGENADADAKSRKKIDG